ncbi:hypothetical protein V8C37DRAFT_3909 [Trichoderma ceciliae]
MAGLVLALQGPRRVQPLYFVHQVQAVRGNKLQARQAADPPKLGFPADFSKHSSEMDEKFLKAILEKADRIWGSPRFCKRRLLLQPITASMEHLLREHLLLCPIRIGSHIAQASTRKCGWCTRFYLSKWLFFAVSTVCVAHRPIVCHLSVNPLRPQRRNAATTNPPVHSPSPLWLESGQWQLVAGVSIRMGTSSLLKATSCFDLPIYLRIQPFLRGDCLLAG